MDKALLRSEMKERLRQQDQATRLRESEAICAALAPRVEHGRVLAFAPLPDEVILGPLLERVAASGRLVLPRVAGDELVLHAVAHLDALRTGILRLRQPPEDAPVIDPAHVDVVLVPGLAFSARGERLGRGRGYYDRLLARLRPDVPRIAVCYACQVVDAVPTEAHDIACTEVVRGPAPESP